MNNNQVPPINGLCNQTFSNVSGGFSMINLSGSDIHVSQSKQAPVIDPYLRTFPILSNLLQPQAVALSGNVENDKAAHVQHSTPYSTINQIEFDHNYGKKSEFEELPTDNVLLTINLTNHTKGIDIKDICGVVLLLKNPTPPVAPQNEPTIITVDDDDVCKTEEVITEPNEELKIENVYEIKPDITLSEPSIEIISEIKPDITPSEPTIKNENKQKDYFQCQYCPKGFLSPNVLKNHMRQDHDQRARKFKCPCCMKFFLTQGIMQRHLKMMHYIKCNYCKSSFEKVAAYKEHLKEKHKNVFYRLCKPYFCEQCSIEFTMKDAFLKHLREHAAFLCSICAEGFSIKEEYKAHEATHPDKYFCPECKKGFKLKCSLKAHESVHNDPFEFICKECNKGFKAKSTLRQHMISHLPKNQYMCDKCSTMFRSQRYLLHHQETVHAGIKSYECPQCDKKFSLKYYLTQHTIVTHLKLKPYQCEFCGEQFARKDYVINHSKIHHKTEKTGLSGTIRKRRRRKGEPPHPKEDLSVDCPICGKTLKSPNNLKLHLSSTHARIRRFKCRFCGLMFLHHTTLYRHERAHDADPKHKFVCPICWKRTETKEQLDAHVEEHNNRPKRHVCDVCGEMFSRRFLLDNHVDVEHTSKEEHIAKENEVMACLTQALNVSTSD